MKKILVNSKYDIAVAKVGEDIQVNGKVISLDLKELPNSRFHLLIDKRSYSAEVVSVDYKTKEAIIKVNGSEYQVSLEDENAKLLASIGIELNKVQSVSNLKAPMPGLVLDILVEPGAQLKKGDSLLVLEAMKME